MRKEESTVCRELCGAEVAEENTQRQKRAVEIGTAQVLLHSFQHKFRQ
jgi:hypothetical protein